MRQCLRFYCPERKAAIEKYKIKVPIRKKDGELSKKFINSYKCAMCKQAFTEKEIQWDHIIPVGEEPKTYPPDPKEWGNYLAKMFCSRDNYQPLCKKCHLIKTNKER